MPYNSGWKSVKLASDYPFHFNGDIFSCISVLSIQLFLYVLVTICYVYVETNVFSLIFIFSLSEYVKVRREIL
jgi:hypothetical protein